MKMRRVERVAALTKKLTDSPKRLFPLQQFCDEFSIAKSTLSEDLSVIREGLAKKELGIIETVTGAAGGVRYIPTRRGHRANEVLLQVQKMLSDPQRILPGGFMYFSDILYDWEIASQLGEILMTRFSYTKPDYVLTVETKGIPLAMMVARAFHVPLAIARREQRVTEGTAISINYVTGKQRRIQTMSLAKRAIPTGAKVLLIDDFMKGGGTAKGMQELVQEMGSYVVGAGVLMATATPSVKHIQRYESLFTLYDVNEVLRHVDVRASLDTVLDEEAKE